MIKKKFLLPMHKHDYGYELSFWDTYKELGRFLPYVVHKNLISILVTDYIQKILTTTWIGQ